MWLARVKRWHELGDAIYRGVCQDRQREARLSRIEIDPDARHQEIALWTHKGCRDSALACNRCHLTFWRREPVVMRWLPCFSLLFMPHIQGARDSQ